VKIYSFQEETGDFLDLKEISIVATSEELTAVIKLLDRALGIGSANGEHIHLQDIWDEWHEELPDIVVSKE
jgi:hypothetical protein